MKTCHGLRASATRRSNSSGVRLSWLVVAGDRVAGDVDGEVADGEALGLGLVVAAQPGAHPGDELLGLERLDDVVVGAGLQAHDDVDGVGLRGEHDDRHAGLGADLAAHLEAVDAREHDVEEHQVGAVLAEDADGGGAVGDVVDLEPLVAQDDAEHLRQRQVVVDDQHATFHVGLVPFPSSATSDASSSHSSLGRPCKRRRGRGPGNYAA